MKENYNLSFGFLRKGKVKLKRKVTVINGIENGRLKMLDNDRKIRMEPIMYIKKYFDNSPSPG